VPTDYIDCQFSHSQNRRTLEEKHKAKQLNKQRKVMEGKLRKGK
jgi:hypothetical protein